MNTERDDAPTLAAIVINYNYAQYVATAIGSALDQDPPFDQIVVVDDGSDDGSLDVIRGFLPRVQLISKANGGRMTATREGIAATSADYVYILDADDYLKPGFVATIRGALASRPAKVQCQLISVDQDGRPIDSIIPSYPAGYDARRMREDNAAMGFYIAPPTTGNVYRRSFLDRLDLGLLESNEPLDGAASMVAPYFGEVVSLSVPLAYYRIHGANYSAHGNPADLMEREVARISRRWRVARQFTAIDLPEGFERKSLFVAERQLMIAALRGRAATVTEIRNYQRALRRSHIGSKQKKALLVWSSLFKVPSAALRRQLVQLRRSAGERSPAIKLLVRLVRPKARGRVAAG